MRSTFAIAALVGSAIAAPSYGRGRPDREVKNVHVVVETVVHTVYLTEGYEVPKPTPSPVYQAPAVSTTVVVEEAEPVKLTPTPEAPKPTPTPEEPQPTPTPAPAPAPSSAPAPSTNTDYMGIVDEYRQKLGLKALARSTKLEGNAQDTAASGNGQMVHKLNPGTFGQTLAPGGPKDFKHVFVGGWLCEIPTMPGLGSECETLSQGWSYQGQTGHAEILTSPNYSEIGCANAGGIWCCDVA